DPEQSDDGKSGIVTADCLHSGCCWFRVGCKKCIQRIAKCQLIGEYCGICVWVPDGGRDEFTKLTLTILDIAMNSPPTVSTPTKEVTLYLNAEVKEIERSKATQIVKSIIHLDNQDDD